MAQKLTFRTRTFFARPGNVTTLDRIKNQTD